MSEQPTITVTLRKPVADKAEAQTLLNVIKTNLENKPDVKISATYNESISPTN